MVNIKKLIFNLSLYAVVIFVMFYFFIETNQASKDKKLIEKSPITKISDISSGFVKVKGVVGPYSNAIIKCPISNQNCTYYRWSVEEYKLVRSGTRKHKRSGFKWVIIKEMEFPAPIIINDETGSIAINIGVRRPRVYNLKEINFNNSNMPDSVKEYLKAEGIEESYFEAKKIKVSELSISAGDTITVLGNVTRSSTIVSVIDSDKSDDFILAGEYKNQ